MIEKVIQRRSERTSTALSVPRDIGMESSCRGKDGIEFIVSRKVY
jgi:hypothetical protein